MAKRAAIPDDVILAVLSQSRRRCAFCFGLNGDDSLRPGQIAHVDRDSSNARLDNLVFLCLEHHDQYDTRTSQSKGLTAAEVIHYRDLLYDHLRTKSSAESSGEAGRITGRILAIFRGTGEIQNQPFASFSLFVVLATSSDVNVPITEAMVRIKFADSADWLELPADHHIEHSITLNSDSGDTHDILLQDHGLFHRGVPIISKSESKQGLIVCLAKRERWGRAVEDYELVLFDALGGRSTIRQRVADLGDPAILYRIAPGLLPTTFNLPEGKPDKR